MNTPAPLSKAQALKKYDKATRLRWRSPISEWRDAFPTVESLAEFRRDVGELSWPGSYGQSPWDDAFSLAYNLGEGISESSRRFMLENADCDWGRQMLAVYAEYGLKVEPSPAPVVAPAEKVSYSAEEAKAMLAKSREDYKSPKGHASWWQKDGAWHIALPDGKGAFLWTADTYDSREQAIAAIESVPAPATDSATHPPGWDLTGVTFISPNHSNKVKWTVERYHRGGAWVCREEQHNTTMHFYESDILDWAKIDPMDEPAPSVESVQPSPEGVACVPAFLGILIAPDGTRHFSCYDAPGMTQERSEAMEYANKEAAEKACLYRLGKGDAYWGSERAARESMAKKMAGWTHSVEIIKDASHKPVCPVHNCRLEFHGYIPTPPDSSTPEEDWRCVECDSPSPAEPVKVPREAGIRQFEASQGKDWNTGESLSAEELQRRDKVDAAVPVKVLGGEPLEATPSSTSPGLDSSSADAPPSPTALLIHGKRNGVDVSSDTGIAVEYSDDSIHIRTTVGELCERFNSHAAQLAKIQALESALGDLAGLVDIWRVTGNPHQDAIFAAARAALALPTA